MGQLVAAAAAFVGLHVLVSGTRVRDLLVARMGEGAYRGAFALASALTLAWLALAYRGVRVIAPPPSLPVLLGMHIVMLAAFVLAVCGLLTPAERDPVARGVYRITRHPFLWGVVLWSLVHLASTRRPPDWFFFTCFLVLAFAGMASVDRKRARRLGVRWDGYSRVTSSLPFAAIAQKRNRLVAGELVDWRAAVAIAVYIGVIALHPVLFGVALDGGY